MQALPEATVILGRVLLLRRKPRQISNINLVSVGRVPSIESRCVFLQARCTYYPRPYTDPITLDIRNVETGTERRISSSREILGSLIKSKLPDFEVVEELDSLPDSSGVS